MLWARPPVRPTEEQVKAFENKLKQVEALDSTLAAAYQEYSQLEANLYADKVWFWRWRSPYRERVLKKQPAVDAAKAQVDAIKRQQERLFSEGKAQLGLWSAAGLAESRDLFWKSFHSGKVFAQRQSFWDAVFRLMNSRDQDWLGLLIQLIITTVVNFTTGLTVSVFVFLARLPSLLLSYQPSWGSLLLFFGAAAVGAVSVVASYLGLLYAAGATAVYTTISLVDARRRIEGPQRRRITGLSSHED
ncbi:hypothetical protein N2152v2_008945 [Parachlorella kessleri]